MEDAELRRRLQLPPSRRAPLDTLDRAALDLVYTAALPEEGPPGVSRRYLVQLVRVLGERAL